MEDFVFGKARTCFKYMTGICDSDFGYLFFVHTQKYSGIRLTTRHPSHEKSMGEHEQFLRLRNKANK